MSNTQIIIIALFFLYWVKEVILNINYSFWLYWWERKSKFYYDRLKEIFGDSYVTWNRFEWTLYIPKEEYGNLKERAFVNKVETFRDLFYPHKNITYYETDNKIMVIFSDEFRHISTIWTNKKYRGLV